MSKTQSSKKTDSQDQSKKESKNSNKKPNGNLFLLLKPYLKYIFALTFLGLLVNGLALVIPKITAVAIDEYSKMSLIPSIFLWILLGIVVGIFVLTIAQSALSTYISELVAKNVRSQLVKSISRQSYGFINQKTPGKLLTNLTADVNEVKTIISQGLITAVSALLTLVGAAIFLLSLNLLLVMMRSLLPIRQFHHQEY